MMNLYEEIGVCTDSDFDDYDFVRVNDNHVALVIDGTGGSSEDYKVLFRYNGVDDEHCNCYQVEIQKRGVRADNYSQTLIKKSKFALTVMFDDSPNFDSEHVFDITVPSDVKLTGEADFVDGKVIVMITGTKEQQNCEQQEKCSKSSSLTDLVENILNSGSSYIPPAQEEPYKWSTTEKYWLDGKEVDKETFEQKAGKDYWKKFDQQFKELDKQFESMNDTFKNLNDVWKLSSSSLKF